MFEFSKRLDKMVLVYLTAIYAAIGLKVSGKLDLSYLYNNPEFTVIAFLFIFMNFSIIIHAISQSSFSMSLAKFIHVIINDEIKSIYKQYGQNAPQSICSWDSWQNDIKGLAVISRDTVMALWVVLVFVVSIYALRLVDIHQFYSQYPLVTIFSVSLLTIIQAIIFYFLQLEIYFVGNFHENSSSFTPPKALFMLISVMISLAVLIFCIMHIIK